MLRRSYGQRDWGAKIDDDDGRAYVRAVQNEGQQVSGTTSAPEPSRASQRPMARRPFSSARPQRAKRRPRRLDLGKTLFILPNAITLAAVFCGFNAIRLMASPGAGPNEFYGAAVLLIFSMFFDLMDGRVARLTKTQSAFGLQMDSLADVISFGVAPALLVYQWVGHRQQLFGLLASFAFVACAAIRLARFNVLSSGDSGAPTKPGKYIVGLPSPPASGVLISLVVANQAMDDRLSDPRYTIALLVLTIGIGLLMVSNVRFRSFKDLRLNTASILLVLFVIASSAFVWQRLRPQFVLVWLLSFYVMIGLIESIRSLALRLVGRAKREAPEPHP
ncbi:MAG TPA: CDP-diacylglycerol--serine O-phosphatidyltransferase [Polyangiaceae bacterium]|nr:CDP-diacylglycerol--serine O-phosphatidyltransferase [Polyangiaceae bacterium]